VRCHRLSATSAAGNASALILQAVEVCMGHADALPRLCSRFPRAKWHMIIWCNLVFT